MDEGVSQQKQQLEQITHGQQRTEQAIGFFYEVPTMMFLA
jgi:hypothetical protein